MVAKGNAVGTVGSLADLRGGFRLRLIADATTDILLASWMACRRTQNLWRPLLASRPVPTTSGVLYCFSRLYRCIAPRVTIKRIRTFGTSKASKGNVEFFEGEYTCASCYVVLYPFELIPLGIRFGRSPRGTTLRAVAADNFGMPTFNATENATSALASQAQTTRCADSFCEATWTNPDVQMFTPLGPCSVRRHVPELRIGECDIHHHSR